MRWLISFQGLIQNFFAGRGGGGGECDIMVFSPLEDLQFSPLNLKKDRSNHQYFIPLGMGQSFMLFTFRTNILVGENMGFGESQVSSCLKHCLLRYNLVVVILEGWGNSFEGNRPFPFPL